MARKRRGKPAAGSAPGAARRRNPLARALADRRYAGKALGKAKIYRRRPRHRGKETDPD